MYQISDASEPNELQIKIWDNTLFTRKNDGIPLPALTTISKVLPKMVDQQKYDTNAQIGSVFGDVGKLSLGLTFMLSFFIKAAMNQLLTIVRSLQIITHMMVMQLNYPRETAIFYALIFEFISFDMIPAQEIYAEIFRFINDSPFSDEANIIGYFSRYFVFNSG